MVVTKVDTRPSKVDGIDPALPEMLEKPGAHLRRFTAVVPRQRGSRLRRGLARNGLPLAGC